MKNLLLSVTLFLSFGAYAGISEVSDVTLQLKEVTLTIDTTTEKSLATDPNCVPSYNAVTEAVNYVNQYKKAIKVLDVVYLNSKDAASCPAQFQLQAVVRYYSK